MLGVRRVNLLPVLDAEHSPFDIMFCYLVEGYFPQVSFLQHVQETQREK